MPVLCTPNACHQLPLSFITDCRTNLTCPVVDSSPEGQHYASWCAWFCPKLLSDFVGLTGQRTCNLFCCCSALARSSLVCSGAIAVLAISRITSRAVIREQMRSHHSSQSDRHAHLRWNTRQAEFESCSCPCDCTRGVYNHIAFHFLNDCLGAQYVFTRCLLYCTLVATFRGVISLTLSLTLTLTLSLPTPPVTLLCTMARRDPLIGSLST